MDNLPEVSFSPIGIVRNSVTEKPDQGFDWSNVVSELVIAPALAKGLDGITNFSHIGVIWWPSLATDPGKMALKVKPRGLSQFNKVGVFASRSPYRPNAIAQTVVRLRSRRGNILRVAGLDAVSGTPILDIKPYIPGYDSAEDATAPPWAKHHRPGH